MGSMLRGKTRTNAPSNTTPPSFAATAKKTIKSFGPRLMRGKRDDWNVGFLDRWNNGGRRSVGAAPYRAGETSTGWSYGEGAYMSNNPQPVDTPDISRECRSA